MAYATTGLTESFDIEIDITSENTKIYVNNNEIMNVILTYTGGKIGVGTTSISVPVSFGDLEVYKENIPLDTHELDKISVFAGYKNFADMVLRFSMPIFLTFFIIAVFWIIFMPMKWIGFVYLIVGLLIVVMYPLTKLSQKRADIHKHLHYFIIL